MGQGEHHNTAADAIESQDRVGRFVAARQADPNAALESFLPAPGRPVRSLVLVALIKADMGLRARAGLPVRVEMYLARFAEDFSDGQVPISLLTEEYWLRHTHADRPGLDGYRHRFPEQFGALLKQLGAETDTRVNPAAPKPGTLAESQAPARSTAKAAPRPPSATGSHVPVANAPGSPGSPTRVTGVPSNPTIPPPETPTSSAFGNDTLPAGLGYRLIRRIGSGAFGEVHEAEAPGGVKVAIKRILRSLDHPASIGEIESLEAIKALSHPFLLKTSAYWVFEDRLLILMELADGSLADRIDFHRKAGNPGVPVEELIPFFEQAAQALDYLHSQNVTHRDVKPQNLLLLHGFAKVADFGLARTQEHTMTVVPGQVGTPMFMAPEVWDQKVSLHSDQYSLAVAYVIARLGRPPFKTLPIHELAHAHKATAPDVSGLTPDEQTVVRRAMAKKPDHRYPNCLAFAEALRDAVFKEPEPPPPAAVTPAPRFWGTVTVAVLTALLCGLFVGGVIWYLVPVPTAQGPTATTLDPPPQAKGYWCPAGWEPLNEAETIGVGNKRYYARLSRTVADERIVAILVPSRKQGDPDTFYLLENKVTNRVFQAEWERATANPTSKVSDLLRTNPPFVPGKWKEGAYDKPSNRLGIGQRPGVPYSQADVPVVAVTVPEAILIAQELGGLLPSKSQWLKAVGSMDNKQPGPAGEDVVVPPELEADPDPLKKRAFRQAELSKRKLALGLDTGPWPVNRWSSDRSTPYDRQPYPIHQLLSNGQEWTRETETGQTLVLDDLPPAGCHVKIVGQRWDRDVVLTLNDVRDKKTTTADWLQCEGLYAGFRIVLVPEQ